MIEEAIVIDSAWYGPIAVWPGLLHHLFPGHRVPQRSLISWRTVNVFPWDEDTGNSP